MTPTQLEFLLNLQKLHPNREAQISKMLRFIATLDNPPVWDQFSSELKLALAANDERNIQLLEGLMRRMQAMLAESHPVKSKKHTKHFLFVIILIVFLVVLLVLTTV